MKRLSLLIVVILFVGILPSLFQYGCFMQLKDFATQMIPYMLETKRMFASGVPFWSWNTWFGTSFMGAYSYGIYTSPFVWIVCLFPENYVHLGILISLFLKMLCIGWLSYIYFLKMAISKELSQIGALMYTFSSYAISTIGYFIFLEPILLFPLLLYTTEKYLRHEKHGGLWLSLAVCFTAFVNYYFLPGAVICVFLYICCRSFSIEISKSYKRIFLGCVLMVVGVAMASIVILPTIMHMEGSSRIGLHFDYSFGGMWERFRTLFMPKLLEQYNPMIGKHTGWFANAPYIPVVGFLLPSLYMLKNRGWLTWILLILLFLYISPLNGIFSLFTNPEYCRWSYCLSFLFIYASLDYIEKKNVVSSKHFYGYVVFSVVVVLVTYINGYRYNETIMRCDVVDNILIISIYIISLLLLFVFVRFQSRKVLLLCVVLLSLIYVPTRILMCTDLYQKVVNTRNHFDTDWNKIGYADTYLLHNHFPRGKSNEFLFRTEFITRTQNIYQNMGLLKNVPSVSTYNSPSIHRVERILRTADTLNSCAIFTPQINVESFDALMSVKNIVVFNDSLRPQVSRKIEGDIKEKGDGYIVYQNQHYLPMGFTYDSYIDEKIIDSLNHRSPKPDIPLLLLSNIAVKEEEIPLVSTFLEKGILNLEASLDSVITERTKNVCSSFVGTTKGFTAEISLSRDNLVFFSVPYDKGFTAFIDSKETKILESNLGMSSVIVPKGKHLIEFRYFPPGLKLGMVISFCSFVIALCISRRNDKQQIVL